MPSGCYQISDLIIFSPDNRTRANDIAVSQINLNNGKQTLATVHKRNWFSPDDQQSSLPVDLGFIASVPSEIIV